VDFGEDVPTAATEARPLRRALQKYVEDPLSEARDSGRNSTARDASDLCRREALGFRPVV